METVLATDCIAEDMAKQLQTYLRKHENDEKLVALETVTKQSSKYGECFTSTINRTTVTGVRGDGSPYNKNFIWKKKCAIYPPASYLDISQFYWNEGYIYSKVLPVLGPFGPVHVHHDEENIITEDLTDKGYVNCNMRNFLDLRHTIFALKMYAKFHASSLAIKINDPRLFDEIATPVKEVFFFSDNPPELIKKFFKTNIKWTLDFIRHIIPLTQELRTMLDIFVGYENNLHKILHQLFCGPKQKYYTICHGDTWLNNLLFLYDDNDELIDMKIVDYQVARYISIASDILYFIYSSVQSSVIENSYESLIKIYHSTLLKELRRLHIGEEVLAELGENWLEAEMKEYAFYALNGGCWVQNAILATDDDINMFKMIKKLPEFPVTITKEKLDRVNCLTSHYYRRYHLGVIHDDLEPLSAAE